MTCIRTVDSITFISLFIFLLVKYNKKLQEYTCVALKLDHLLVANTQLLRVGTLVNRKRKKKLQIDKFEQVRRSELLLGISGPAKFFFSFCSAKVFSNHSWRMSEAKVYTSLQNVRTAAANQEKKTVFKHVLASPFILKWPTIHTDLGQTILDQLLK